MLAICNTKIILEEGMIWDGTVLCKEDRIADFGPGNEVTIPEGADILDAKGWRQSRATVLPQD